MQSFVTLAAAASAIAAPALTSLFSNSDYPEWAIREGASAASIVEVWAGPEGKVISCINAGSFGNRRLADEICSILKRKRVRFQPTSEGLRLHAYYKTVIKLFLPDTLEGRKVSAVQESPDAELSVERLPNNSPSMVTIQLTYDREGKITGCEPAQPLGDSMLANAACSQRSLFNNVIRKNAAGTAVPYLSWKKVRFTQPSQTEEQ